jgi:hypothetical protein
MLLCTMEPGLVCPTVPLPRCSPAFWRARLFLSWAMACSQNIGWRRDRVSDILQVRWIVTSAYFPNGYVWVGLGLTKLSGSSVRMADYLDPLLLGRTPCRWPEAVNQSDMELG